MPDVSATDAARRFSDLLDAVEHSGEHFTVIRHGRAVAHIEPVQTGGGADLKAVLKGHRPDKAWARQLDEIRDLLEVEQRQ
ncbi:MAG: prevent-host-death protein [Actinomycetia bacterium]|nr:prevent-host-death protein [Actinomycetes bacterium]